MSAACPSCGSLDVRRVESVSWRCNACDALYDVAEDGAVTVREAGRRPSPAAAAPAAAGTSWGRLLGVAAVWVFGGLAVLLYLQPTPAPLPEGPEVAVVAPGKVRGMSLAVEDIREGRVDGDTPFWLMTLRNNGTRTLRSPSVIVRLYDERGASVGQLTAASWVDVLAPGEETYALAHDDRPARHTRVELDPDTLTAAPEGSKAQQMFVKADAPSPEGDASVISGEVMNTLEVAMRVGSVVVVGRSEDGKPVSWGEGPADAETLAPEGKTRFKVPGFRFKVEEPFAWTAYARAKPAPVEEPPPAAPGEPL